MTSVFFWKELDGSLTTYPGGAATGLDAGAAPPAPGRGGRLGAAPPGAVGAGRFGSGGGPEGAGLLGITGLAAAAAAPPGGCCGRPIAGEILPAPQELVLYDEVVEDPYDAPYDPPPPYEEVEPPP